MHFGVEIYVYCLFEINGVCCTLVIGLGLTISIITFSKARKERKEKKKKNKMGRVGKVGFSMLPYLTLSISSLLLFIVIGDTLIIIITILVRCHLSSVGRTL